MFRPYTLFHLFRSFCLAAVDLAWKYWVKEKEPRCGTHAAIEMRLHRIRIKQSCAVNAKPNEWNKQIPYKIKLSTPVLPTSATNVVFVHFSFFVSWALAEKAREPITYDMNQKWLCSLLKSEPARQNLPLFYPCAQECTLVGQQKTENNRQHQLKKRQPVNKHLIFVVTHQFSLKAWQVFFDLQARATSEIAVARLRDHGNR